MNTAQKKAVLFVPFWRMAGHVGNHRIDRFRRWLSSDGYQIVVIRAGEKEGVCNEEWGIEITVVDRLGLHPESKPEQAIAVSKRKPSKLRRAVANWLFNPDPAVVWAKAAARHPKVIEAVKGASLILSSSPPDSVHVGAWMLSEKTGVPMIMDMRDGWLDEPLKPLLNTSAFRRWREGRLESRIAKHAKVIQVTSDVWKELFDTRYPYLAAKVHVLTNGYPTQMPLQIRNAEREIKKEFILIYAGQFTHSQKARLPELLMAPLLKNLALKPSEGVIRFYGNLSNEEVECIQSFEKQFMKINWRIEFHGMVPRIEMLAAMQQADGLLLLSASHAAIPSKLFEYLATELPIGYVAPQGSATDRVLKDFGNVVNLVSSRVGIFELPTGKIPENYRERSLSRKFSEVLHFVFSE